MPIAGVWLDGQQRRIMSVRAGKVCHQVGVADNLLALQQLGAVADPTGFTGSSPRVR